MRKVFLSLIFWGMASAAAAQLYPTQYRPGNVSWQQLKTPHFRIVYPKGEDSVALRSGKMLEQQYDEAARLTGGSLSDFPVILNNYNDLSNGFVTTFHFRSEIDIHTFKGKSFNPQSGNWLETVVPHELVHATHYNNRGNRGSFGLGSMAGPFSPDLARSFHGAVPSGIAEGLAVYHETDEVVPGGGRGNYPYFANEFDAALHSGDSWSMGQLVHSSSRTRPFLRHYMGGYEFISWLQKTYGPDISRKALDFYIRWPILGYGVALKKVTGKWPGALYSDFREDKESEQQEKEAFQQVDTLPVNLKGAKIRQPRWLDESTLIFYGSFYNHRSGFYTYRLDGKELNRIHTTNIVQDFQYDLSEDGSRLIYSYYRANPIYDNVFRTELVELELNSGNAKKISSPQRLYAPSYEKPFHANTSRSNSFHDNGSRTHSSPNNGSRNHSSQDHASRDNLSAVKRNILALSHRHASNSLVRYHPEKGESELAKLGKDKLIALEVSPGGARQWAVIANRRGMQALWITTPEEIQSDLEGPPDLSFEGASIFDPSWHPTADKLLFSCDRGNSLNIYEYDLRRDRVVQLTNTRYNSFEASYAPEGDRIAFIQQQGNETRPVVLEEELYFGREVSRDARNRSGPGRKRLEAQEMGSQVDTSGEEWKKSSYSEGLSWLKPRTVLPVFEEVSNRGVYKAGVGFHSNNLLQSQSYSAESYWLQKRAWYDLSYQNKQFYPGFKTSVFSLPEFRTFAFPTDEGKVAQTMLRQERGISLSIPVPLVLENNVTFSSLRVEPEFRLSRIRFYELDHNGTASSNFSNRPIFSLSTSLSYKLQQNIRDVQPNSGLFLYSEYENHLSAEELRINTLGSTFKTAAIAPEGFAGGVFAYISPLKRWNQTLRVGLEGITQTGAVFDKQFLVSEGFSEALFLDSNELFSLSTRYTVPFLYADNGGFLLPLYLSNLYLVAFSNTVGAPGGPDFLESTRTVFGAELRAQLKLGNLSIDIGIGYGYEPTRDEGNLFIGNF